VLALALPLLVALALPLLALALASAGGAFRLLLLSSLLPHTGLGSRGWAGVCACGGVGADAGSSQVSVTWTTGPRPGLHRPESGTRHSAPYLAAAQARASEKGRLTTSAWWAHRASAPGSGEAGSAGTITARCARWGAANWKARLSPAWL